jgi:hypothetical protein
MLRVAMAKAGGDNDPAEDSVADAVRALVNGCCQNTIGDVMKPSAPFFSDIDYSLLADTVVAPSEAPFSSDLDSPLIADTMVAPSEVPLLGDTKSSLV